jgi:hypothetical protein
MIEAASMTRGDWFWIAAWMIGSSLYCVTSAAQLGATFDEPLYIARGLERWRSGSHAGLLRLGTMPLPADVQTLPLYLRERWSGVPFDPNTDLDRLLPWARAANLAFWWLLLGYGWLAGHELAGRRGGRLAVALLACEPSLLAHASLATTDVAVSACVLALAYHFRTGREAAWPRRLAVPALWFAAAVLAKASALVIGPLCLLAIEAQRRAAGRGTLARDLIWILAVGLVLVFLYCGSDWKAEPSFVAWARDLPPESRLRPAMIWLAEHLRIFSNAGEAIVRQVRHNLRGHGTFLLGESHPRAPWYYFPAAMSIKLSEPLLLAPVFALVIRRRSLVNWALLSAALLVVYSLTFRVQLGIRMVLPVVVLGIAGIAATLAQLGEAVNPSRRRSLLRAVPIVAVAWTVLAALAAWPHALAYVNRFWGGSAEGYRLVSDSNYDWGQGLPELRRWAQQRGLTEIDVWYFGTDPAIHAAPFRVLPLHAMPIREPGDVPVHTRAAYLAASTTLVYGLAQSDAHRAAALFLRVRRPAARTSTFLIYDLAVGRAPSRPYARRVPPAEDEVGRAVPAREDAWRRPRAELVTRSP